MNFAEFMLFLLVYFCVSINLYLSINTIVLKPFLSYESGKCLLYGGMHVFLLQSEASKNFLKGGTPPGLPSTDCI